jgi:hypothetical protein
MANRVSSRTVHWEASESSDHRDDESCVIVIPRECVVKADDGGHREEMQEPQVEDVPIVIAQENELTSDRCPGSPKVENGIMEITGESYQTPNSKHRRRGFLLFENFFV